MSGVVAFLTARLDEDEASARATAPSGARWTWRTDVMTDDHGNDVGFCVISDPDVAGVSEAWGLERGTGQQVAEHIARHDPARVLREVEAKRMILEHHSSFDPCFYDQPDGGDECPDIRALAAVYSDHPDYLEEWKP